MKLAVAAVALLLAGCSSSDNPAAPATDEQPPSWIAMVPGDALEFHGPGGKMLLIYVDETYYMDKVNAQALTWELGDDVTMDYFLQDDDGTLWWYGRKGSWRAGSHGEEPREIDIADHKAEFGNHVITLSDDGEPVQLETPAGVYAPKIS